METKKHKKSLRAAVIDSPIIKLSIDDIKKTVKKCLSQPNDTTIYGLVDYPDVIKKLTK